jgi:hypothetical protein
MGAGMRQVVPMRAAGAARRNDCRTRTIVRVLQTLLHADDSEGNGGVSMTLSVAVLWTRMVTGIWAMTETPKEDGRESADKVG